MIYYNSWDKKCKSVFGAVVKGENVTFTVLEHNAETNGGSSGGAILNIDLELIGIHYAGSRDSSGNFVRGYAIPIDKIHEFLNKYIWGK